MKKIVLIWCLCHAFLLQSQEIDSLQTLLKNSRDNLETTKINLKLAKLYERIDLKEGMNYAYEATKFKENDSINAEAKNQLGRFHFFNNQLDSASIYFEDAKSILEKLEDNNRAALIKISLGAIYLRQGNYEKTIATLTQSASFFEASKDDLNAAKCYSNISSAFAELNNYDKAIEYSEKTVTIFEAQNQTPFQLLTLPNLATQYFKKGDTIQAIKNYNKAETLAKNLNNKRSLSVIYNNLGSIYLNTDYGKAKNYLEQALSLKNELNLRAGIEITQSNLGYVYLQFNELNKAKTYLELALPQVKGKQRVFVYNNLMDVYKKRNELNQALEVSEKARLLNDSLLSAANQETILDIQTKYETEKKEQEILQLQTENLLTESKRKQNKNLLFAALVLLTFLLIAIYLQSKNAKRKRIILEQEHTIKTQEFEKQLNEQELNGIDAIIDAQEKERNKIAEDLHDNLGSKIATLKLYMESYDEKESFGSFYEKLKKLMNETYTEVRTLSKNKKFGTKIDKGLIPSTRAIAQQISEAKKMSIHVNNIDVQKSIDSSIELQLFRIIQELITNIIKHSKATEASIQFSEDADKLNIIVEDNGIGFDPSKNVSGIGLINIEKRVDKIHGDLFIDSDINNGTTIILNIPI